MDELKSEYYSGYAEDKKEVMDALKKSAGFIRTEIGKAVKVRHIPELRFSFDESFKEDPKPTPEPPKEEKHYCAKYNNKYYDSQNSDSKLNQN